jgi:hypothetical protein
MQSKTEILRSLKCTDVKFIKTSELYYPARLSCGFEISVSP